MDQNIDSLHGLSVDMLPMDVDLSAIESETQPHNEQQAYVTSPLTGQAPPLSNGPPVVPGDAYVAVPGNSNGNGMAAIVPGPLPTGYGIPSGGASGSTLTEFTKRRNWSQRVLEELKDLLHILTPEGRILYASPSCKYLTGYDPGQILGRFLTEFIHQDDAGLFLREFNESIASNNPLRMFFRFRKDDSQYIIFEAHGHPHLGSEALNYPPNSGQSFCRGFFMMARPYPTKNAALLDSFLEHKMENERLTKRIADLKREEQEDQDAQERQWAQVKDARNNALASEILRMENRTDAESMANYNGMPPPAKPIISNIALTRQNLDEALAASKPDSINDKMARYEGVSHIDTIEMLTGLQYRNGERSQGISTGHQSPSLIRGDAGIPIQMDKESRTTSDKKKKIKIADEYVCTDCGTLDSPEWRKGPNGPKTLCNACGLRWAKKEKKKKQSIGGAGDTSSAGASIQKSAGGT